MMNGAENAIGLSIERDYVGLLADSLSHDFFLPINSQASQAVIDTLCADLVSHSDSFIADATNLWSVPEEDELGSTCKMFHSSMDVLDDVEDENVSIHFNKDIHLLQLPHQLDKSSLKSKKILIKRKRKQDISVRKNDHIEFLEVMAMGSANGRETRRPSLKNIQNTISERRPSNSRIYEFATVDMVNRRQESIAKKLLYSPTMYIQFTELEEFDILQRANLFLESVKPDPRFCVAPGETVSATVSIAVENVPCYEVSAGLQGSPLLFPPQPVYTVTEKSYMFKENKFRKMLGIGTQLLKPGQKLVELVALAIDESPDGLLQVQQVYNYLMLKYPYFAFLDKLSTSSWRSSIRHALYQKWFKKIAVCDEKIGNKGCFWAINRQNTPKEWTIPSYVSPEKTNNNTNANPDMTHVKLSEPKEIISASKSLATLRQSVQEQKDDGACTSISPPTKTSASLSKPTQPVVWQPQVKYAAHGKPERRMRPYGYRPRFMPTKPYQIYSCPPGVQYRPMTPKNLSSTYMLPSPHTFFYRGGASSTCFTTMSASNTVISTAIESAGLPQVTP